MPADTDLSSEIEDAVQAISGEDEGESATSEEGDGSAAGDASGNASEDNMLEDNVQEENVGESGSDEEEGADSEDAPVNEGVAGDVAEDEDFVPISGEVLTEAARVGIPIDDAVMFPNELSLLRAIELVKAQSTSSSESTTPEKGASEHEQAEIAKLLDSIPKLDPNEYDETAIKAVNQLTETARKLAEEVEVLKQAREQDLQQAASYSAQQAEQWFDDQVNRLVSDNQQFKELLGDGRYSSLEAGSEALLRRSELAEQIQVLLAGYNAAGLAPPPSDDIFQKAVRMTFADDLLKIHEQEISSKLQKRKEQHLQRGGSGKGGSNKEPEDAIAEMLNQRFFGSGA